MATASAATAEVLDPPEPLRPKHGAVIVGGGPTGIAAALALTKLRGWTGVTVVERADDLAWADPDRSYVYSIDARGMRCAALLGLDDDVKTAGVDFRTVELRSVDAKGKAITRKIPVKDDSKTTYWMPRATFMRVLAKGVEDFNSSAGDGDAKSIRVLTSSRVVKLQRVKGGGGSPDRLAVTVRTKKGGSGEGKDSEEEEEVLYPSLVLGCDGINSLVRTTLQQWASEDAHSSHSFALHCYPSPATGLRFKVLQLPPNPVTRDGILLSNPSFGVIAGTYKGSSLRLGLLPVKDSSGGRTGNIITKPDHPFWTIPIGDIAAYKTALQEAFPQIDLASIVPEEAIHAFASSEGGVFPAPQASDGVAFVLDGQASTSVRCAVLVVGDAAHAFPPDLGQGVNSGLEDVESLVQILSSHGDSVASSAEAYEKERGPEADAIARLVQVGLPYQYQQDFIRSRIYLVGFLLRSGLNKALGNGLIAPNIFTMVQDPTMKYSQILARDIEAKQRISAGLVGIAAILAWLTLSLL